MIQHANDKNTDIMKKLIATLAAAVMAVGSLSAQDLAQATELYNTGATYLSGGNFERALESFQQAYDMATALGEEGAEVAENCKSAIPEVSLNLAKNLAQNKDYDGAIARLGTTVELAGQFGDQAVQDEANALVPQLLMQKGNELLNGKDFAGAAATYKQILESDATNGVAALRLGMALANSGDAAGAIEAFTTAAANGQEAAAGKQLGNLYLRDALAKLKAKDYAGAVDAAVKSTEYSESSSAYQIAGQAAQMTGDNDGAIKYFEKYLELAPNAKNAGQIAYTVGALYQTAKNVDKAKEYYTKALSDPTYGPEAQKLLNALK